MTPELLGPLRSLSRAYHTALLYPEDHPAVPRSAEKAYEDLAELLAKTGSLAVRVGRDRLRIGEEEIQGDPGSPIHSLNALLYDLEALLLVIEGGVTLGELRDLIRNLAHARRDLIPGRKLLRSLQDADLNHIRFEFVDYGALTFREGAREREEEGEDEDEDLWLGLHRRLTEGPRKEGDPGPEALAHRVSAELSLREGTGVGLLRQELRRAQEALGGLRDEELRAARQRVVKFLRTLSPALRSDLLRIYPRHSEAPLQLLNEFSEDLPSSDILQSLHAIDRLEGPVPELLVSLMTKLTRLADDRSSLETGLQQVFRRWGLSQESTSAAKAELREAMAEVLQRRGELSPNPESYSELLEELSREDGSTAEALPSRRLYRDPGSETEVKVQAAEISAHLLMEADRADYRHGLLACLGSAAESILTQGDLRLLAMAVRRAEELVRRPGESEATRRAARGLLADLRDRSKLSQVTRAADSQGELSPDALFLLKIGGELGIEAAIDALERSPSPMLADGYREFLQSQSPALLAGVLTRRAGEGSQSLRSLISLSDQLPDGDALPILEKLFRDSDPQLRLAALEVLVRRQKDEARLAGQLRVGLRDPDERVADKTVELLIELKGGRTREVLAEFLEASVRAGKGSDERIPRAAERLVHGGVESGRLKLISLLGELRWSLGADKVRLASTIAEVLSPFAGQPQVREALRRFEKSPAGVLARMRQSRGEPSG